MAKLLCIFILLVVLSVGCESEVYVPAKITKVELIYQSGHATQCIVDITVNSGDTYQFSFSEDTDSQEALDACASHKMLDRVRLHFIHNGDYMGWNPRREMR